MTLHLGRHEDYVYLPVRINGRRVGNFMFDTGSNLNVITIGEANRLQLPKTTEHTVRGVGGADTYTQRAVESITAGGLRLNLDNLAGINLHHMYRGQSVSVAGILGFHAFGDHPFTLDYANNRMIVHPLEGFSPPADAYRQPYTELAGLPVVQATVGEDVETLLLVDTGAGQSVVLDRVTSLQPNVLAVSLAGHARTLGIGGSIAGSRSWLTQATIFGQTMKHIDVSIEPTPASLQTPAGPIGRLGNRLLQNWRLTFVPREQMIYAQWQEEPEDADE